MMLRMASERVFQFNPKTLLDRIDGGKVTLKFAGNEAIFRQGDVANAVFYLQEGRVKLTVVSKQGKEAIIALLEEGSFFGEGCLVGQRVRMSSATAMGSATVVSITKESMVRLLHKQPDFAEAFISYLVLRNTRIEEDLVDQLFNSAEKRLARTLLLLARYGKESKPEPIIPKVSHETLAEMVGTTRSRITFFMNRFKKMGFVDYDAKSGSLEVHNALLNVVLRD